MSGPLDYGTLAGLIGARTQADCACPVCGPGRSSPRTQQARKLRLWRLGECAISYNCVRCNLAGFATAANSRPLSESERRRMEQMFAEARRRSEAERRRNREKAASLWRQTIDSAHTWADSYLRMRGIALPAESYLRRRTLRFHPHCPRPDLRPGPALVCAFEPILPGEPFHDAPVVAIHRIWGRGHRKAMLGAVAGCAVKITPDERVLSRLSICEGIETGLKLLERGDPVWALASAGGIEAFPAIPRIRDLRVYADNDASGRGLEAAKRCAGRWRQAGKRVEILMLPQEGADYGEA
ncbi:hypothetical protein GOD68_17955 [Sinorhizobium medicae]|nr:hypothetical protein [Sinorhizobium medicae]MDX0671886.1 hypothetical protein [Sinorhizobium medicae]MDX0709166.1 hypothetical protein [Sinorhizobium medicae]